MTSTNQEYWDASLIRAWRQDMILFDVINMWESITNKVYQTERESLLRAPHSGFPWKIRVRVMVAELLPKINERLWNQPPEKDVLLLKALTNSNYTVERSSSKYVSELRWSAKKIKNNENKMILESSNYSRRNRSTDWDVNKAPKGRIR